MIQKIGVLSTLGVVGLEGRLDRCLAYWIVGSWGKGAGGIRRSDFDKVRSRCIALDTRERCN